jgi:hypothetical protein
MYEGHAYKMPISRSPRVLAILWTLRLGVEAWAATSISSFESKEQLARDYRAGV